MGFGQSDEYSFVFKRDTKEARRDKEVLTSSVVADFSAGFAYYFEDTFKV